MRVKKYNSKYGITKLKRGESTFLDFKTVKDYNNIRVAVSLAKARHGHEYKTQKLDKKIKVKRIK